MKHLKFLLLLLLAGLAAQTMNAHDFEVNGIYYYINGSNAIVTYLGTDYYYYSNAYTGTVNIPSTVTYSGKTYSVTSIGFGAFRGCSGLTSVTIPNSVTTIGEEAFYCCTGLTEVTIPNSVTTIGNSAFSHCYGLTSVTIPNSVTTIGNSVFSHCYGLTEVTIPNSVTTIGSSAFGGCTGLTSVAIPNSVTMIGSYAFEGTAWFNNQPDGLVYAGMVAYKYKGTMPSGTSIVLKDGCTGIAGSAFWKCYGLTSVTIPNSVTTIGEEAFYCCTGLTEVTIPNLVTTIGEEAFYCCTGLTSVTIPNSVTTIGYGAFSYCTGLTSVTWNAKSYADFSSYSSAPFFSIRANIRTFTFGEEVENIPAYLFYEMAKLTSVTIPNSVTEIGDYAFYGCTGLTSVTWNARSCADFSSSNSPFYSIRTNIQNFTFGEEVENIPAYLCDGMTKLTSVTIPNSVTTIGDEAFSYCIALDSIICYAVEPPAISKHTFSSYNSLLTIPDMSSYKYHTAPYWENFKNISYIDASTLSIGCDAITICRGIDADFSVPIRMHNTRPITAMQCDVSSSITINGVVLNNSRNGGDHTLSYYNNKILIVSPTLKTFKGSDGTLFSINLHTNSTTAGKVGNITLSDIIMSTTDGAGIFRQGCTVPVYMTYLIGDANGDGSVDAADYVVTCNTIALRPVTTFFQDAANVNQDSHLDVSDLVGITRIALGLDATQMHAPRSKANHLSATPADVKLSSHDIDIANGETATLTIKLNSPIAYKAMQMDMMLPAGLKITSAQLGDRAGALRLMTSETEDGSTRLVASTMGDGVITAGDGVLLTLTLAADNQWSGDGTISLSNIIAATPNAERHEIEGITINATGTPSGIGIIINDDSNTLVDVYNLNGQLVKTNVKRSEAAKGLPAGYYIIGEEKVYVK